MKYDQLIIYYFSGTGNAKNAALWIGEIAEENGLKTHLINIDRFNTIDAQLLPALILRFKGFRIVGMQPLDLPSNWLLIHPGLKNNVIDSIYERCHGIVTDFAENMLDGKRKYKALLSLPVDLALIPISVGYYFFGRFFLAKTLVATNACTNCNLCVSKCPVEAIKTVGERLFWTYKCESCMRCVNICPHRAIETTHGFSGLIIVIVYALLIPFIISVLKYYDILDIAKQSWLFGQFWFLIESSIFIIVVFLSYKILYFLMKYNIVNRIITYSSLSKYKFWRRYKSPVY